jgi:hypothetical protein
MPDLEPIAFISEEISVEFERPPMLSKKPDAPIAFAWGDQSFKVVEVLSRWFDFERRGNMSRNMQEAHLRTAGQRGSWGVGRFYFRVRTEVDRVFDLYYDRTPEDAADRQGHWFLWRELAATAPGK